MSEEFAASPAIVESEVLNPPDTVPPKATATPWITRLAIAACVFIYLGLAAANDYQSLQTLSKFGYESAQSVSNGAYWAFITTVFVHFDPIHALANIYWLWRLGIPVEQTIGSRRYLAFFLAAAFVSSSCEFALGDHMGIGMSGVVYAIFGFVWATRWRYPGFKQLLNSELISLFILWMGGCFLATRLQMVPIGNVAHMTGLMFGGAIGLFVIQYRRPVVIASLVLLITFAIVPLFWRPWSVVWLSQQAYNAHAAGKYDIALEHYSHIIRNDPKNAWAYLNRSYVYESLGEPEKANADLKQARELDPKIEEGK